MLSREIGWHSGGPGPQEGAWTLLLPGDEGMAELAPVSTQITVCRGANGPITRPLTRSQPFPHALLPWCCFPCELVITLRRWKLDHAKAPPRPHPRRGTRVLCIYFLSGLLLWPSLQISNNPASFPGMSSCKPPSPCLLLPLGPRPPSVVLSGTHAVQAGGEGTHRRGRSAERLPVGLFPRAAREDRREIMKQCFWNLKAVGPRPELCICEQ